MIVKKYKADTETAAILAAKEDLGPEAVVLNVKTMKQRGFARFFKHDYVEITAALEEKEFEQKVSSRRPAVNAAATKEIKPAADKMSGIDYRVDMPKKRMWNRKKHPIIRQSPRTIILNR